VTDIAPPRAGGPRPARLRRVGVVALIVLAALLLMVTTFAVWVDRVALNTDVFTDTSSELIDDGQIRRAIATKTIDEIYDSVDVEEELERPLPEDVESLAGPTSAGLRQLGPGIVERALGQPALRRLWRRALERAHETLVDVLEERSGTVSTQEGVVTLDLGDIVVEAADRIGVSDSIQRRIDEDAGQVELFRSDDLDTAQDAFRVLNASAWFLPLVTLAIFGLALWLSHGRRRLAVRAIGIAVFLSGVLGLLAVNLTGWYLVRSLASESDSREAGGSAWDIVTELLRGSFKLQLLVGLLVLLAAWLAGPSPLAVAVRRTLAPLLSLRRYAYGALALLALLLLFVGEVTDFAELLGRLVLVGLLAGWIEWMRRQTRAEFPEVTAPAVLSGTGAQVAEWLQGRRTSSGGFGRAGTGATGAGGRSVESSLDLTSRLQQLADLHARGELTDEEYAAAKTRVLSGE
jgi:Short C-terminal domain